jgi:ABC-type glycerol-3-phosphate transport system substrate-binding protein
LKIEPVGEKIDEVFNRLKTALTDPDKPSGQDAFVEFLERSSVDKIKATFIGLLPERWSVLEQLLNSTQNRIITRDIAPKLVEVVFSIFMTTPQVTNREQLARWILRNEGTIASILTGKRDAQALLQEAVNQFRNQGINP